MGQTYRVAREYRANERDRAFYVPKEKEQRVYVYNADKHPESKAPAPPRI